MITNELIANHKTTATETSLALDLGDRTGYSAQATFDTYEVKRLTFPAVAASTGGDYVVIYDAAGLTWGVSLDKAGTDPEPTGAEWVAIPAGRKTHVNISGGTDAASVAALVETAVDALTGFTAKIITDDAAANGTMLLQMQQAGTVATPVPHNADDSGAGTIVCAAVTDTAVVGSLKLQGSLDGVYFADIANSTQAVSVTTQTAFMWSIADAYYRYVRAVWTFTSGYADFIVTSIIKENDNK